MIPKVLLLTGNVPGTQGVGQIFLHDLVVGFPRDKISCFAVIEPGMQCDSADIDWLPIEYAVRPREAGVGRFGKWLLKLSSLVVWQFTKWFRIPGLINRASAFGREQGTEIVWAVLSSPVLIYLARKVANRLNVPLVVTIWDPPELFKENLAMGEFAYTKLESEFRRVLKRSIRCGVASEGMAEAYKEEYGINPIVQIKGVDHHIVRPPSQGFLADDTLVLGFAGSFYTHEEWNSLLKALDEINWIVGDRKIKLRILSNQQPFALRGGRIQYLGWQNTVNTIKLLSESDILYLPYWFSEDYSLIVRLCFPNKLATYLAAGKPVLFHGPVDSSPSYFLSRYPAGSCCHSNNKEDIITSLQSMIDDKQLYARTAKACSEAINKELSLDVFRTRFAELIGVTGTELN